MKGYFALISPGERNFQVHPLVQAHAAGAGKLLHPFVGMRQPGQSR